MNKLLIVALVLISTGYVSAQNSTSRADTMLLSKRGYAILPEAGDFGIGFNAVPFLQYAGNLFSGSTGRNSIATDFQDSRQQIVGKYFLDKNTAIRGRFQFQVEGDVDKNRVALDNQATPDPNVQVTDQRSINSNYIEIAAGIEKRRGQGRLYGIYGGEVSIISESQKTTTEYGNPISLDNQKPTSTTNFNNGSNTVLTQRTIEFVGNGDKSFGFGLNGFAGVEYFFAPKMGLSAEFTYGFIARKDLRGKTVQEQWNTNSQSVQEIETVTEGGSSFDLDTGNVGGAINLFFYF